MSEPAKKAASQKESKEAPIRGGADELLSLADLEQAAANFEGAVRTYRQVLDGTVTLLEKARALRGVGSCLERIGRWKEALNVLEDAAVAARQAESDDELGKILIKLGKIHFGQGHIDVALRCGDEALALIDPKTDPSSRGFALNLLGSAFNRQGDLDRSAQCFRQALSSFKGAGDIRSLSLAYNNLGLIYKEKCDWRMALEYLQVAASLKAIEGDYPERRGDLKNLGLVYYKMGNWDRARECFAESLEVSRSVNDPIEVIRALLGVAGVDLVHRRWDEALEGLEQALELCSDEQYPRETALTYRSLGQLHQARGELSRARRCLEVAWRKAVESSPEGDLARELLRLRAELALTEGQDADAANLARRAVELSSRFNDRMETALAKVTLGRVLLHQGDANGYQELSEAEEELRRLGSPLPLAQVLLEQGRQRLRLNHELPRSEALLVEARQILAELSLHEMEVETLIALSNVSSRRGELDRAGEFLEQARNRVNGLDSSTSRALLAEAQKDLENRLVETSVTNLGAFRTAGRLEEIVESRRPYADKLNQVLEIMAQAVEADGASLVFVAEDQPGATYRIGSEAAQRLTAVLRSLRPERPEILLDAGTAVRQPWTEVAATRKASSLLAIPIYGNGTAAYLYLDRLADHRRSSFGPSHLNLCLALVPQLEALVDRAALESVINRTEEDSLSRRVFLADVVTQNPEMIEILKLVEKVNRTDLTVLLQGETGTGKTLIARALHLSSNRAAGAFVTVDCAALPENLLESELFGYVKGAFTGASHDKKGLFEEADGGTIFLDEIGKAGLGVQRRLLHLLDRGEVRPVGSTQYRKLNVRVIVATSKKDLLEQGDEPFIKDLYFRLNDIIIRVPALRERPEDIPLLTEYFLETFNSQTGRGVPGFTRAAIQRMVRYAWPGNVRELEKVVRRAAILAEDAETIGVDLLPREVLTATEIVSTSSGLDSDADLRSTVVDMERRLVVEALEKHAWNKTRAAKEVGLSRKGLKNKITRYGIKPATRV